jgi:hypothetical protein
VVGLRDLAFGYRIQRTEADRFKVAATQLLKLSTQKPPRRTVHSFATFSVFRSVDAGRGLLIFALPPGEAAFHPSDENGGHELYFICDDLKAEMASLAKKDVKCTEVQGTMGFDNQDAASRRRPGRPVPAKASLSDRPEMKSVLKPSDRRVLWTD